MSKPILRDPSENPPAASETSQDHLPIGNRRPADMEMARLLKTAPLQTHPVVVSVAMALGYASQTAFAAAFRRLTEETPSDWRRRAR